jgi:hypothetical protein
MRALHCLLPALLLASTVARAAPPDDLAATIAALDTAAFDAFNHCDAPGQLDRTRASSRPTSSSITTSAASPGRATT